MKVTDLKDKKIQKLVSILKSFDSLAVAFSAGVDSTFLLKAAHDILGDQCLALTACAAFQPGRERQEVQDFCEKAGIRSMVFWIDEETIPHFSENPQNRCYYCKHALFRKMKSLAASQGISRLAEGSNTDDLSDYRPGMQAIKELGVLSPLRDAGLSKEEIRSFSRQLNLPSWDKPSMACLASRIPYGQTITKEKLRKIEKAEAVLADLGLRQYRVRLHEDMARIEVMPSDFPKLILEENRMRILTVFQKLGFSYIAMDLKGFRSGSMNEAMKSPERDEEFFPDKNNK